MHQPIIQDRLSILELFTMSLTDDLVKGFVSALGRKGGEGRIRKLGILCKQIEIYRLSIADVMRC